MRRDAVLARVQSRSVDGHGGVPFEMKEKIVPTVLTVAEKIAQTATII